MLTKPVLKNVNESKNIKKGCNILKILNKIIIFFEYVQYKLNCQEKNVKLKKLIKLEEKKNKSFF